MNQRMRFLCTMPHKRIPEEPDYWVTFSCTPAEKPNGHYHANDPDTPAPAVVEEIKVEMPDDVRAKFGDYAPETWPEIETACYDHLYTQRWREGLS